MTCTIVFRNSVVQMTLKAPRRGSRYTPRFITTAEEGRAHATPTQEIFAAAL